ncbi:MAG: fibronectin type III domain-containing protein [Planctomycetes bacterium]|nr:fibronectin type III domain-containing protein [Planctomycetota bacterium]
MHGRLAKIGVFATVLLLTVTEPAGASLAPAPPSPTVPANSPCEPGSPRIRAPEEQRRALQCCRALLAGERLPWNLRALRALLERNDADARPGYWQVALDFLHDSAGEHKAQTRFYVQRDLQLVLERIVRTAWDALPPVGAFDHPNDGGDALVVFWRPQPGATGYVVQRRAAEGNGVWQTVAHAESAAFETKDRWRVSPGQSYVYRVCAVDAEGDRRLLGESETVAPRRNWFHTRRWGLLTIITLVCAAVLGCVWLARRGAKMRVRRIAGLEAVNEAVGRATELDRPILFVPGIEDINEMETVAGLTILGHVAHTAATCEAVLEVPTRRALVMTAAREAVRTSFTNAGRPEAYDEASVYYCTDEQFGYVAAVAGKMIRQPPAACFFMGSFHAESLILAETGNAVGSLQIAGTAQPTQLPFFVAACDYTLIGEELFAASAYLSGEPQLLGSLKGQDLGKLVAVGLILFGSLLATLAASGVGQFERVGAALDFLQHGLLRTAG